MLRPMKGVIGYLGADLPPAEVVDVPVDNMKPTNDEMDTYAQSQGYSSYNAMVYALKQPVIDQRQAQLAVQGSGPTPPSAVAPGRSYGQTFFSDIFGTTAPASTNYASGNAASMGPPRPAASSGFSLLDILKGVGGAAPAIVQTVQTFQNPLLPQTIAQRQQAALDRIKGKTPVTRTSTTPWGTYAIIGAALLLAGGTAYLVTSKGSGATRVRGRVKRAGRRAAIRYARYRRGKRGRR